MGAVSVRAGYPGDLDAIAAIEEEVFDSDRLSRRSLRRFLDLPSTDPWVAETAAGLAGYAMIGFRRDSGIGRIFSLAVRPRATRRGIGRSLLRACELGAWQRGCTRVRLEVRADNAAAIALYHGAAYALLGHVEDYYEDGGAALRLEKGRGADENASA